MCLAQQNVKSGNLAYSDERTMDAVITGLIKDGKPQNALILWQKMQHSDPSSITGPTCVALLKACAKQKDFENGFKIHAEVAKSGLLGSDLFVGNTLVDMYAKCGLLTKAQQAFDDLPSRDVVAWTILIAGYGEHGYNEEALDCLERMQHDQVLPNCVTYVCSLKACGSIGAIDKGQEIHAEIERRGLGEAKPAVGNTLISMYVKFGLLAKAQEVFDSLPAHNVVSWTSLIAGYAEQGHEDDALECFEEMQLEGISPDAFTFACGLKACGTLGAIKKGKQLQAEVERKGLIGKDLFIGNTLVDMYVKWGMPARAQEIFDKLPVQEVVSWTALLSGYTETGLGEDALRIFEQMQLEGTFPNVATYVCALKACGTTMASDKGREIHAKLVGLDSLKRDLLSTNSLVDMYAKCGLLSKAQDVFDRVPDRDVVLWTTLITGYVGHGNAKEALECFEKMHQQAVPPDVVSFVSSLKACGSLGLTDKGRKIHSEAVKKGFVVGKIAVSNVLVDMYSKCGKLKEAQVVFDMIPSPNVISWNALITGYVEHGLGNEAMERFKQMEQKAVSPDSLTYVCSLKACCIVESTDKGRGLHIEIEKMGFLEKEDIVGNALVDMYAKCGSVAEAHQVFDSLHKRDVVSWNSLIGGYVEHGHSQEALKLIELMQRHGIFPNAVTYLCGLKACTSLAAIERGEELHAEIEKSGLLERDHTVGSALVDMYAKCGVLAKAVEVFNKIPVKDVVSWTSLIAGYVDQGYGEEALHCFDQMQLKGVPPNAATFVSSLKACCSIGDMRTGADIHAEIERRGLLERNLVVGNALIDMYAKCGLLARAQAVFDKIPFRNVVSWTSLIAGYTEHGPEEDALKCLEQMQLEGISPDSLTLACSLRACGSVGATSKGQEIHADFERKGLWSSDIKVENALVEMYVKCGSFTLAKQVFDKLPVQDVASWNSLITGYIESGYVEEALECFERMQYEGITPNAESLVCTLKACGSIGALEKGCKLHTLIDSKDLSSSDRVGNTLLDMYAKCGEISKAREVFDNLPVQDVVSWTALIARYVEHGHGEEALNCFEQMQFRGVCPDCITYVCVLKACGSVGAIDKGREIHIEVEKKGRFKANPVIGNTVVNMYAICGFLEEAERVFDKLPTRDVVSWNALMAGYAEVGESEKVFCSFDRMLGDNVNPDSVTFLVVLNACKHKGMVDASQRFLELMSTHGIVPTLDHLTGVVDLLCRAGQSGTAIELVRKSSFCSDMVMCRTILNLCKKWGNMTLGSYIFKQAMPLNAEECAVSKVISEIYDVHEYGRNIGKDFDVCEVADCSFG